jgi:hypothetical protein
VKHLALFFQNPDKFFLQDEQLGCKAEVPASRPQRQESRKTQRIVASGHASEAIGEPSNVSKQSVMSLT